MNSRQRFSASEVLSQLFDSESGIEENVAEDPGYENETLGVDPPVVSKPPVDSVLSQPPRADTLPPKNGNLLWPLSPLERQGRLNAAIVIRMVPGPAGYAVSHVQDIKSAFELSITPSIKKDIIETTILEGMHVYGDSWKDMDVTHLQGNTGSFLSRV